jgi:hypothetical protein
MGCDSVSLFLYMWVDPVTDVSEQLKKEAAYTRGYTQAPKDIVPDLKELHMKDVARVLYESFDNDAVVRSEPGSFIYCIELSKPVMVCDLEGLVSSASKFTLNTGDVIVLDVLFNKYR